MISLQDYILYLDYDIIQEICSKYDNLKFSDVLYIVGMINSHGSLREKGNVLAK